MRKRSACARPEWGRMSPSLQGLGGASALQELLSALQEPLRGFQARLPLFPSCPLQKRLPVDDISVKCLVASATHNLFQGEMTMHYSRRDEPFRYTFPEPLPCKFQITRINGHAAESSFGSLRLLDLSWNGAKIATAFDFQHPAHTVELTLFVQIMTAERALSGTIVHQEQTASGFLCGIHLDGDAEVREWVTNELKAYAKQAVNNRNKNKIMKKNS